MTLTAQRRAAHRPSGLPVAYWNDEFLEEGTVVELKPDRICLIGTFMATPGTRLKLILYSPDNPVPLYIPHAVVRRIREQELDVDFVTVPKEDQTRLDAFCSIAEPRHSMASDQDLGGHRVATD